MRDRYRRTAAEPKFSSGYADKANAAGQEWVIATLFVHDDVAFILDRSGNIREELSDDPGPGTTSSLSSYAVLLADAARQTLGQP
jgi:hypothetical protein